MPTLRDVAEIAGVSTATVSHVINNSRHITPETRARVERAIAETGFVPNEFGQMLAKQRTAKRQQKAAAKETTHADETKRRHESNRRFVNARRASSKSVDAAPSGAFSAPSNQRETKSAARHARIQSEADESSRAVGGNTTYFLLKLVRAAQPISRVELARRLKVNRSTVTEIVRPLIDAGILREDARRLSSETRAGRPPIGLALRPERAVFIGANLGVRQSQVGAMTIDNKLLAEESFDTPPEADEALEALRRAIERVSVKASDEAEVFIGISVPSPVDAERARLLYAPHLNWRDLDLAARVRPSAAAKPNVRQARIIVENDATAAGVYEARRRLRDATDDAWDDFVLVRAGTGIGVGLMLGGDAYREGGIAGEFGHMTIVAGGKPCACGNRGCWERYASATSAVALYQGERLQTGATNLRFVDIVARAEAGERRAQATLEQIGEYLGIGIANVITGLGIGRVIVSGRVVYGWKFIKEPLRAAVARTMAGRLTNWSVQAGEPHGSGLGGAFEVAVDAYLTTLTEKQGGTINE
jgi:predicted NBD/HSP70 family sugar kinase/plasmid maintenance system antidote protein VapI